MDAVFLNNLKPFWFLIFSLLCCLITFIMVVTMDDLDDHLTFLLSLFFAIFMITHALWLHKFIQSFRRDFHKKEISSERVEAHDTIINMPFFQELSKQLSIYPSLHMEAQSFQSNQTHLLLSNQLLPLLRDELIEILTEPIVSLPQKRLAFFSCMPVLTVHENLTINLLTLKNLSHNLLWQNAFDMMVLFQTLQFIRRQGETHPNHGFICHLPSTVYKDIECFHEIIKFLLKSHFPFHSLIFLIPIEHTHNLLHHFPQKNPYGIRFISIWQDHTSFLTASELAKLPVDFIMLSYPQLSLWAKQKTRAQGRQTLDQILNGTSQIIISQVSQEQELYTQFPLSFDYASGNAFGLAKPFYHFQ